MTFIATSTRRSWQRMGAIASLSLGLTVLLSSQAQAQYSTDAEALEPETTNDVFRAGENDLRNPLDLYHRANLANSRTPAEFMEQQRSILGTEIESLRLQQQQLLLQGQPAQPATTIQSAPEETPVTP